MIVYKNLLHVKTNLELNENHLFFKNTKTMNELNTLNV